jgi:uncharacterized protein YhjY with autotransporter beta-barrel domain
MRNLDQCSKLPVVLTVLCSICAFQLVGNGQVIIVDAARTDSVNATNDSLADGGSVQVTAPAGAITTTDEDGISLPTNTGGTGVTVTIDAGRTITVTGTGSANGINLGSGSATNDGTITTNGDSASAGISIQEVTAGGITNNGSIVTNGTDAAGGNYGIRINQGDVINAATGTIDTNGPFAAGIIIDPDQLGGPGGNVNNFGTITTQGNDSPGILSFAGGNITNEAGATITTNGTFTGGFVDGIFLRGSSSDTATNDGTININGASSFTPLLIGGITVDGGATAINNGTINLNNNGVDGGELNAGLYSFGGSSSLSNSSTGTINVLSVNSSGFAAALGGNTMLNDGTITVNPGNPTGIAAAITNGMLGSTAGGDTITNSATGTITVNANGGSGGIANGMNSAGGNTLINDGAITLNASRANGITSTGDDTVTNSGTITTNSAENNGMNLSGGTTATNEGTITVNNATNNTGVLLSGATSTSFTNASGGTINLNATSNAIESEGGGAGHVMVNDGTINSGTGPAAPGSNAFVVGDGDTATNNGTINTFDTASTAFNTFEAGAIIVNNGTINSRDTGIAGAATSINDNFGAASITNSGTINNDTPGGNAIFSSSALTVNSGLINDPDAFGPGVSPLDSNGIVFGVNPGDILNNTGAINVNETAGTDVAAIISNGVGNTINHSGSIMTTSTGAGLANGIVLNGAGADTVNILPGGMISVPNDGSLAILGNTAQDHVITVDGGILTNNNLGVGNVVSLAGGDDTFSIRGGFAVSGIVDLGGQGGVGDTLNVSNIIAPQTVVDSIALVAAAPPAAGSFTTPNGTFEWNDVENFNFDLNTIFSAQAVLPPSLSDFGNALDNANILLDTEFAPLISALSNVPRGQFTDIARTLSGQSTFDAMTKIQFQANANFTNSFFRRLGDFKGGNPLNSFNGFTIHNADMPALLASTEHMLTASSAMRAASDSYSSAASTFLGAMTLSEMLELEVERDEIVDKRIVTDVIGYGTYAEQDGTEDRQEGKYYLANATLRAGYRATNDLTVGAYAGYNHTDAETDNAGSELTNMGAHAGGFIDYRHKQFRISALAGYTYSSYESERRVFGQTASGDTTGHQIMLAAEATYDHFIDKDKTWTISPILGLNFAHHWIEGYTENGAGVANLTVDDQDSQSLQSKVGAEASKSFYYGIENRVTLFGNAFYRREFLDDGRDVDVAFNSAAINAFTVQTEDPARDFFDIGLGFEAQPFSNPYFRLMGGYQYQMNLDDFTAHNLYGGARYDF